MIVGFGNLLSKDVRQRWVLVLVFVHKTEAQVWVGGIVLTMAYMLHSIFKPYKDAALGRLESLSIVSVAACLYLGSALGWTDDYKSQVAIRILVAFITIAMLLKFAHVLLLVGKVRVVSRFLKAPKESKIAGSMQAGNSTGDAVEVQAGPNLSFTNPMNPVFPGADSLKLREC